MKMNKLPEKILSYMVKEYKKSDNAHFPFAAIKNAFPTFTDNYLTNAIYLLKNDGYVNVLCADNIAYITILLPEGIKHCENNTWISKCYYWLKEIRNFFR